MNFITSDEMRVRDGNAVANLNKGVSHESGYGVYRRAAEQTKCPGLTATLNNAVYGYPDLVISGTVDATAAQHKWVLNFLCSFIMEDQAIDPTESYVDIINQYLAHMGMETAYKAVLIDTDQFLWGYGMNARRYYAEGGVDPALITMIQIIEMDTSLGCFPAISTMSQVLFPTVPFGNKEPVNANLPPVQNFASNSGQGYPTH